MGIVITFPADRCSGGGALAQAQGEAGSIIILPVIRIERQAEQPHDGREPSTSSPRGKRRKR
jgi:hypothetical protein